MNRRWRWNRTLTKLVEITANDAPEPRVYVHGDTPDFVSPIDGRVVSGRRQMRIHNAQHGVVPSQEFSQDYLAKKTQERLNRAAGVDKESRQQRRESIARAMEQVNAKR